jgi:hypothetical protein
VKVIDGRCSSGCSDACCEVSLGDQEHGISSPDGSWCSSMVSRALSSVSLSSLSGDEAPVLFNEETQDDSMSSPDSSWCSSAVPARTLSLSGVSGDENQFRKMTLEQLMDDNVLSFGCSLGSFDDSGCSSLMCGSGGSTPPLAICDKLSSVPLLPGSDSLGPSSSSSSCHDPCLAPHSELTVVELIDDTLMLFASPPGSLDNLSASASSSSICSTPPLSLSKKEDSHIGSVPVSQIDDTLMLFASPPGSLDDLSASASSSSASICSTRLTMPPPSLSKKDYSDLVPLASFTDSSSMQPLLSSSRLDSCSSSPPSTTTTKSIFRALPRWLKRRSGNELRIKF